VSGIAIQTALPYSREWRQPPNSAQPASGERTAGAQTTGQTPARGSRFRAMWRPLAEDEERDAERRDNPVAQTPGNAAPASPPDSSSQAPLGALAWEGEPAPGSQAEPGLTSEDPGLAGQPGSPVVGYAATAPKDESLAGSQAQPGLASEDPLEDLAGIEPCLSGKPGGSTPPPQPATSADLRRMSSRLPPASDAEPAVQSVSTGAAAPLPATGMPSDAAGQPDVSATGIAPAPKPGAKRSGEVKSPAADAASGSSSRAARSAANPSAVSSRDEAATPDTLRDSRSQLAFSGRLEPVSADAEAPSAVPTPASLQAPGPEMGSDPGGASALAGGGEPAGTVPVSTAGAANGDGAGTPGAGSRDPAVPGAPSGRGTGPALDRSRETASGAAQAVEANPQAGAANPAAATFSPESQRSESAAKAPGQPAAARSASDPESAAPQKVAHDITLDLDSGSRRAAVRLTERGGEVHVAVRTPDAGLAADLRQGLPSLAAKLEQSGFRAEAWHTASTPRHPADASAESAGQNQSGQNGQESSRERRQGQPQPQESGQRPQIKKEGRDFAWFMASLG